MGTGVSYTEPPFHRVQLLEQLNQATHRISSILDVERLLDTVVNEVADAFGLCHAIVLLRDPASNDLVTAAVRGSSEEKGSRFRIGRDGLVGQTAALRRAYYARDVREEPLYICCNRRIRSELDIPIVSGDELLGVLSFEREQVSGFTDDDVEVFTNLAENIAIAIQNSRRYEHVHIAHSRLAQAEEEARLVQRSLFPQAPPVLPGFLFDGECMFAGRTGGDWFDYIPLGPSRYGVVLADVSGKGMAAALLMTTTRSLLRLLAKQHSEPADVLSHLNQALLQEFPDARYVTMIYGVMDAEKRTWTFSNAGHPAPLFAHNGTVEYLHTQTGFPLALLESAYDQRTVDLPPGSQLLLYSDGVTEAYGNDKVEFGADNLQSCAREGALTTETLLSAVSRYSVPNLLQDDATAVILSSLN